MSGEATSIDEPTPEWWRSYGGEFPDWHAWEGVAGILYARRPKSSPPKVVRAKTPEDLRDQILLALGVSPLERARWDTGQ